MERPDYRIKPTVILNRSKIILMEFKNFKFIDSLNNFYMPLSSLPKAYALISITKGTFSHFFNVPENQLYVGNIPQLEIYSGNSMNLLERERFLEWYHERVAGGYVFDFQTQLRRYCKQNLQIFR